MKRFVIMITLMFCTAAMHAQELKGKTMISGSTGFYSTNLKADNSAPANSLKQSGWHVSPSAGYFITNEIAAGITATYRRWNFSNPGYSISFPSPSERTSNSWSAGPFVRYYKFINSIEGVALYGQLAAEYVYGTAREKNPSWINKSTSNGMNAHFNVAAAYFFSDKISIDLSLAGITYYYSDTETEWGDPAYSDIQNSSSHQFSLGLNIARPSFGFQLYF